MSGVRPCDVVASARYSGSPSFTSLKPIGFANEGFSIRLRPGNVIVLTSLDAWLSPACALSLNWHGMGLLTGNHCDVACGILGNGVSETCWLSLLASEGGCRQSLNDMKLVKKRGGYDKQLF